MSSKTQVPVNANTKPSLNADKAELLQRKCACGNSAGLTGECATCQTEKLTLQRKQTAAQDKAEVPPIAHEALLLPRVPFIQAKLTIGASDDPLEREADRVADQVMSAPLHPVVSGAPPRIQRFTGQATGNTDMAVPVSVDRVLSSPGRLLEPGLQQDMEQRFGHDFSQVRVHTDAAAERSAREVNANAYTVRHNIVFGAGCYAPGTHEGRRLIAHELTHTIQQNAARNLVTDTKQEQISTVGGRLVQRDATLDDLYNNALQAARQTGNFQDAAEKLNGFNHVDIQNRLAQLTQDEVGYMHLGALDNPRVGPDSNVAKMTKLGIPRASTAPATASSTPAAGPSKAAGVGKQKEAQEAGQGVVKVGDIVLGDGTLSLAVAGGEVEGGAVKASGVLTVNGAVLMGGASVVAVQGGTVTTGTTVGRAVAKAVTDVASTNPEAKRIAWQEMVKLLQRSPTAAPTFSLGRLALRGGVITAGFAVGVAIAIGIPMAIAYAKIVSKRGEFGGTLPPGGVPTPAMDEPGDAGVAEAPGSDNEGPAHAPGTESGGPAIAPGAANTPATAPGQSSSTLHLGGKRIPLTSSRAKRLEKAEKAEKWTDLLGRDRTSLGKAYNHIIQTLVREIAAGGRATVLHYPKLTKALIAELAKKGGRVIITEGVLPNGGRFDIAEINFDTATAEVVDITAVTGRVHGGKTADYASEIGKLTGFPVTAYEGQYVDGNELSDEIIIVEIH